MNEPNYQSKLDRRKQTAVSMALGVGLGATLGAALGNIALGLTLGIILGGIRSIWQASAADNNHKKNDGVRE
ncbi:MAG TPA: hypothetical protein DCY42_04240 [Chloroflexi bacterium]|nr:hypothetical protein [Chloroflexota bacterium]